MLSPLNSLLFLRTHTEVDRREVLSQKVHAFFLVLKLGWRRGALSHGHSLALDVQDKGVLLAWERDTGITGPENE